jgi:hypothetical protein
MSWLSLRGMVLLASSGLCAIVLSCLIGTRVHDCLLQWASEESATRTPVRAVLLHDTAMPASVIQGVSTLAKVRWVDASGETHVSETPIDAVPGVGKEATVWVDHANRLVPAPSTVDEAFYAGYVGTIAALLMIIVTLALVWYGVRRIVWLRAGARWEREWAQVEPLWSQRFGGSLW